MDKAHLRRLAKQQDDPFGRTRMLLGGYGKWARDNPISRMRYRSILGIMMDSANERASGKYYEDISDDTGLLIDSSMVRLKSKDEFISTLLIYHYVGLMSGAALSQHFGVSAGQASYKLLIGLAWIDGQLDVA